VKSCWQIRNDQGANGERWRINCADCRALATGVSCWELDTPGCCAPVHVTCDFCSLYIDHRREIASLTQKLQTNEAIGATFLSLGHDPDDDQTLQAGYAAIDLPTRQVSATTWPTAPWGEPVSSSKEDASSIMEKQQLNVPDMYADHHVLRVRAVLAALEPKVQNIVASSAFRLLAFEYDPAMISVEAVQAALAEAGYPTGAGQPVMVNPLSAPVTPANSHADPAWERLGVRISRTDVRDAKPAR
jgi:hypothetical protein